MIAGQERRTWVEEGFCRHQWLEESWSPGNLHCYSLCLVTDPWNLFQNHGWFSQQLQKQRATVDLKCCMLKDIRSVNNFFFIYLESPRRVEHTVPEVRRRTASSEAYCVDSWAYHQEDGVRPVDLCCHDQC